MFCSYGAKKTSILSSTKLCTVNSFKKYFKYDAQTTQETQMYKKLEPIRDVFGIRNQNLQNAYVPG